jgi:8-oxo-dGTP pyrophosphatase MutT (NUDIX family)
MLSFDLWIDKIIKSIDKGLPGEQAQFKMAPVSRLKKGYYLNDPALIPKLSAVAVLVFPINDIAHLLLTERTERLSSHSSQISFPGGKFDDSDFNLLNTSLRELKEEVGIDKENVNLISPLTDLYIPVSNFKVNPYLFFSANEINPVINKDEVNEVVLLKLNDLVSEEIRKEKKMNLSYEFNSNVPYFDVNGKVVWGATAMILSEFREILLDT